MGRPWERHNIYKDPGNKDTATASTMALTKTTTTTTISTSATTIDEKTVYRLCMDASIVSLLTIFMWSGLKLTFWRNPS